MLHKKTFTRKENNPTSLPTGLNLSTWNFRATVNKTTVLGTRTLPSIIISRHEYTLIKLLDRFPVSKTTDML